MCTDQTFLSWKLRSVYYKWSLVDSGNCCKIVQPYWLNDYCLTSGDQLFSYIPLVVNPSRSFPRSRLITGFVTRLTRLVPLVEQELLTLPVSWIVVCPFVLFLLAIVLSVLLRYTDSNYPFGTFKLFLFDL